jgi:gamma-glutamyltranspeptidase/glutathione hydrolase
MTRGMTIAPHPLAADAGLEMLRAGGNAFDAIVAAAFTEAVVEPAHNGVAGYGGGAVLFLASEERVVSVDFNTEAPAAATPGMFPTAAAANGVYSVPGAAHRRGALSIGIPGVVAGLEEIRRSWGTLPLPTLLAPAIRAAREGWECNPLTAINLKENAAAIASDFPDTAEILMPGGRVPAAGDRMANPELAATLEHLASTGLRDFYEGDLAHRLAASLREQGAILTAADLAGYRARHVAPTATAYHEHVLHTTPVGCGGVTSFQILQVLEAFDLNDRPPDGVPFYHLFAETLKACWRRRLQELGDPAFTGVPELHQLDPGGIAKLQREVRSALDHPEPGVRFAPDPFQCTSHLCAADTAGNVASLTQTHGAAFGSWVSVPGTGLTFGHGMARFDPRPGLPNSIAPGKRPLHNMAPMIATRDAPRGHPPVAAYGTPGGRTIVNNQALFSLCLFRLGLSPEATLALPRLHVEEAEPIKLEQSARPAAFEALRALGHQLEPVERNGGPAHILLIGEGPTALHGATDPRGNGKVAWA